MRNISLVIGMILINILMRMHDVGITMFVLVNLTFTAILLTLLVSGVRKAMLLIREITEYRRRSKIQA